MFKDFTFKSVVAVLFVAVVVITVPVSSHVYAESVVAVFDTRYPKEGWNFGYVLEPRLNGATEGIGSRQFLMAVPNQGVIAGKFRISGEIVYFLPKDIEMAFAIGRLEANAIEIQESFRGTPHRKYRTVKFRDDLLLATPADVAQLPENTLGLIVGVDQKEFFKSGSSLHELDAIDAIEAASYPLKTERSLPVTESERAMDAFLKFMSKSPDLLGRKDLSDSNSVVSIETVGPSDQPTGALITMASRSGKKMAFRLGSLDPEAEVRTLSDQSNLETPKLYIAQKGYHGATYWGGFPRRTTQHLYMKSSSTALSVEMEVEGWFSITGARCVYQINSVAVAAAASKI